MKPQARERYTVYLRRMSVRWQRFEYALRGRFRWLFGCCYVWVFACFFLGSAILLWFSTAPTAGVTLAHFAFVVSGLVRVRVRTEQDVTCDCGWLDPASDHLWHILIWRFAGDVTGLRGWLLCCILQHTVLMIWFMVTPNIASMEVGTVVLIDQLQLIVTESPLHKLWIAGLVSHFCGCKAGQHAWLCNSSWDAGRELDVQGGKPWLWPSSWSQEWSWSQCPAGYFFNHALDINAIEIGWVFAPRF